jgi:hypothetical protein
LGLTIMSDLHYLDLENISDHVYSFLPFHNRKK